MLPKNLTLSKIADFPQMTESCLWPSLHVLGKMTAGENKITIHGPNSDGTYVIELRTAEGDGLAISVPRTEAAVLKHFQARMPHGVVVPDVGGDDPSRG